jgi:hypothetical protein
MIIVLVLQAMREDVGLGGNSRQRPTVSMCDVVIASQYHGVTSPYGTVPAQKIVAIINFLSRNSRPSVSKGAVRDRASRF